MRNAPTATDFRTGLDVAGLGDGGPDETGSAVVDASRLIAAPNPFPASTELSFRLAHSGQTSLVVYDLQGRQVDRIFDGWLEAGTNAIRWDAPATLPAGVYFARLETVGGTTELRVVRITRSR